MNELSEQDILDGLEGVPTTRIGLEVIENGLGVIDALAAKGGFLPSNGEARRALQQNAVSVNKVKVGENFVLHKHDLIKGKFVILGKGKKDNYLLIVE